MFVLATCSNTECWCYIHALGTWNGLWQIRCEVATVVVVMVFDGTGWEADYVGQSVIFAPPLLCLSVHRAEVRASTVEVR